MSVLWSGQVGDGGSDQDDRRIPPPDWFGGGKCGVPNKTLKKRDSKVIKEAEGMTRVHPPLFDDVDYAAPSTKSRKTNGGLEFTSFGDY